MVPYAYPVTVQMVTEKSVETDLCKSKYPPATGNLARSAPNLVFTLTGKRAKTREVPLHEDVVRLLATHGKEFPEEDVGCADPANAQELARKIKAVLAMKRREAL